MIRINLLRERDSEKGGAFSRETAVLLAFLVLLVAVGLTMGSWYWHLSEQRDQRRSQVAGLEREAAQLKKIQSQLKEFEQLTTKLGNQLKVIDSLKSQHRGPIQLMNALIASAPEEPSLWLTSLSQRGNKLTLEGKASDVPAIADFISQLSRRPPFKSVELNFWERKEGALNFKLSCLLENR
ncbi:MAG: PilN domain-containing protein [Acidobacteriota bacterium]